MDKEPEELFLEVIPVLGPDSPEERPPSPSPSPEPLQEKFFLDENVPAQILTKIIRKMAIKTFTKVFRSNSEINELMEYNWKNFNCYIDYEFCIAPEDKPSDMIQGTYDTTFYIFSTTFYEIFDGFLFDDIDKIINNYGFVRFGTIKIGNDLVGKGFSLEKTVKIVNCLQQNKMTCDQLILQSFVEAEKAVAVTKAKKVTIHHRETTPVEVISAKLLSNLDECIIVIHSWDTKKDDNHVIFHNIIPSIQLAVMCLFVPFSLPYFVNFLQKIVNGSALTKEFYLDYWQHPPVILSAMKAVLSDAFPQTTLADANIFPPGIVALIPLSNVKRKWLCFILEEWGRWALLRGFIVDSWEDANRKEMKKRTKFFRCRQGRETAIDSYLTEEDITRMKQVFESVEISEE